MRKTLPSAFQSFPRLPALLLAVVILLAGCAKKDEEEVFATNPNEGKTAVQLYNEGLAEVVAGRPGPASLLFDEVERNYPYSPLATRARMMSAWALYQSNNYNLAVAAIDGFVELHPAHEAVPYMLYIKALCYYERIVDVERDAGMTLAAKQSFEELLLKFPDSPYTRDARLKLDLTISHLAGKEMAVGRFYLTRGHYDAALRRFAAVVEQYDISNQTPEALYRMAEAYLALGLRGEAARAREVLLYNYPDSIWAGRVNTLVANPAGTDRDKPGFFRGLPGRGNPAG